MLSRTLTFRVRKSPTNRGVCPTCVLSLDVSRRVLRCLASSVRACRTSLGVFGTLISGLLRNRVRFWCSKFLVLSSRLILLRLRVSRRVPHLWVSRLKGVVSLVTGIILVIEVSFPRARSVCRNLLAVRNGRRLVVRLRKCPRSPRRALVLPWKTLSNRGLVVSVRVLFVGLGSVVFWVNVRVWVVRWLILLCRCRRPVVNLVISLGSSRSALCSSLLIRGLGLISRLSIWPSRPLMV